MVKKAPRRVVPKGKGKKRTPQKRSPPPENTSESVEASSSSIPPLTTCMGCFEDFPESAFQTCSCEHKLCFECLKHYMVQSGTPVCMGCKNQFTESYLHRIMDPKWMTKVYKPFLKETYHKELMGDRLARSEEVALHNEYIRLGEQIDILREQYKELRAARDDNRPNRDGSGYEQWLEAYRRVDANTREQNRVQRERGRLRRQLLGEDVVNQEESIQRAQRRGGNFVFVCPENDCLGVVGSNHRCGICEKRACPRCQRPNPEIEGQTHTCNEGDLATVRLLRTQDTRTCPKCHMGIQRVFGCDQMFCPYPNCRTFFNWETGEADMSGTYHNPEATRLARELGVTTAAFRNGQGGNLPNPDRGCNFTEYGDFDGSDKEHALLYNIYHRLAEIPGSVSRKLRYAPDWKLLEYRVKMMKGEMTKRDYQNRVYASERLGKRRESLRNNLNTLYTVGRDNYTYFRDAYPRLRSKSEKQAMVDGFLEQMETIRREFNRVLMEDVGYLGGSVAPYIPKNWTIWCDRKKGMDDDTTHVERLNANDMGRVRTLARRLELQAAQTMTPVQLKESYPYGFPLESIGRFLRSY